jgi:hypothetical protein
MKSTPKKKGNDLEQAVRAIEDAILRAAPGYSEGTFKIQGNKVIVHDGVRHEIDVFVTASLAAGYESTFIFECKNWNAKVGKNELIIFSEKVAVSGAQRGFFVAKAFTKDAQAQAKKDVRIQLMTASHFEPVTRVQFPQLHLLNVTATHANVEIRGFNDNGAPKELQLDGKTIVIHGTSASANEYIQQVIAHARDTKLNKTATQAFGEGTHEISFCETIEFNEGDAFIESKPIKSIGINGTAQFEVVLGSVLSVYEVQSRGRMLIVGASSHGIEMQAHFVEVPAP